MNSRLAGLTWEIWRRGRGYAWAVAGCLSVCAFVNLVILDRLGLAESSRAHFNPFFGLLMVLSFLLLMGIFNYTEANAAKDWNGFPYRLFVLPLRTWQLVALPMFLGVASVELTYFAWIKLVWTHEQIPMSEWFAVVLGAYAVFYQTTLWTLAGFRIMRIVALSFGGVSSIAVVCLPFFARIIPAPWLTEKLLITLVIGMAAIAFVIGWVAVARQRSGGGRRRNWIKMLLDWSMDLMPRRTKDFASPAAAQFWFEWRRTGWLLPACTAFLLAILALGSWFNRADPRFTNYMLGRLLFTPIVLAFVVGKGFMKCEFWSTNLSFPTFVAAKPLACGEFVITKMKVAALSVAITWLLIVGFIVPWLALWANTAELKPHIYQFRTFHPHSWPILLVLVLAAFMVFTWRCMVNGLWVGLSGSRRHYVGSLCFQVMVPLVLLLAVGIWSDDIDAQVQNRPQVVISWAVTFAGWIMAFAIVCKVWLSVVTWRKISEQRSLQYLLIWSGATLSFVAAAALAIPSFDVYRLTHLLFLAALLLFPLARLGIAPLSLARNRHR